MSFHNFYKDFAHPLFMDRSINSNQNSIPNAPSNINVEEEKKKFEKTKKKIDKIKDLIVKKYKSVQAVGLLAPQSVRAWIDEDECPKESAEHVHIMMIVNSDSEKTLDKIKAEVILEIEKSKEKIWLHLFTPNDIWEICMDQKFELSNSIAMAYPLFDKGILGALRVAEIHKSLVLQKFDKYVVSYVIAGSLVRGEAEKDSDVDVFVIINDTDVKRMPRRELLERLRGMIYQYVAEASRIAGVNNKLEPQVYLLTDFWDSVKDAQPVMFTFIRDGVPLFDKGTFMPWKALLRMGKLKPSPESINMFMSMGDDVINRSKKTLLSGIFTNIFWGVTTPAQAMLMLNGCPPPNAKKELIRDFKKEFLKTKMIEKKYIDFLEEIVGTWRDYEHEKIKEISGAKIDELLKRTADFLDRLKKLRVEIEKKAQEETIEKVYKDIIDLLRNVVGKKCATKKLIDEFKIKFVNNGVFANKHLRMINNIIKARAEHKKGKSDLHKIDRARRDADSLSKDFIEYLQRKEMGSIEKGKVVFKFKDKIIEVLSAGSKIFLFEDGEIKKIEGKEIVPANLDELEEALGSQRNRNTAEISYEVFDVLKKKYGKFEIVL